MTPEDAMHRHMLTCQAFGHFCALYEDEIGNPADASVVEQFECDATVTGWCYGFVLASGLCVVMWRDTDRWSLYETRARAEACEYDEEWLAYYKTKGHWTREVPTRPGVYATRNRDGITCDDRRFVRTLVGDKEVVRDVTVFCPAHKRTEWAGDFWSLPRPTLRARTEFGT